MGTVLLYPNIFFFKKTSEVNNSKPTEHKFDKKNELEKSSESNNSPNGIVCDRDAKDNKLIKHVSNDTSENMSSVTSVSSEDNKFVDKTKDVAGQTTANKKNEQLLSADDVIHVQHECFGKAWGRLNPKLYISPDSKCIKCVECCKYRHHTTYKALTMV